VRSQEIRKQALALAGRCLQRFSFGSLCMFALALASELPVLFVRVVMLSFTIEILDSLNGDPSQGPQWLWVGALPTLWATFALLTPVGSGWWWKQRSGGRTPSARGGIGLRLTRPVWGHYWRRREYAADAHAAKLGQADELADFLETHALLHDHPIPYIWLTQHTHPPVELRIDRLRNHETRTQLLRDRRQTAELQEPKKGRSLTRPFFGFCNGKDRNYRR